MTNRKPITYPDVLGVASGDVGALPNAAYDLLDRNTTMTFHDGSTRTNTFNAASDIIGYTDENGSHFANTWDVLARKTAVAITLASGVTGTTAQAFQFDGLARVTLGRDFAGGYADAGFTYDSIDRVLEEQQTYSGDTRYITHNAWTSYAGTGFTFPNGRQITKSFDALYRKDGINETSGGASIAAWQFFGARTAAVTLGNGIVTSFMNNAQTRSAIQLGQTTPAWGDTTTDHLGYDGAARPIGKRHILSGTTIVGFTSAYDPSSNKLFERALHAESRSALYANDSMDRLLQYLRGTLATGGGSISTPIALPSTDSQRAYALDGLGNWQNTSFTPVASPPGLELRTHNRLNQIVAVGVAPTSTPVLYDHGNNTGASAACGNGNIVSDGVRLNSFDAFNRLHIAKRASDGLQIGLYIYDAFDRRIIRETTNGGLSTFVPNATSRYLLDGQQIVEELSGLTGAAAIQHVWGQYIDELIQLKALTTIGPQPLSAGNYYLLSDLLYRSAALTDSSGAIVEAYDTDAYGNTLLFSAGGGTGGAWWSNADTQAAYSACRYAFTGRECDAETGNYFYRARYHSSRFGRFLSKDSLAYIDGTNLYVYATSAPTVARDPSGMVCTIAVRCGWAGLTGVNVFAHHCGLIVTDNWGTWGVDGSGLGTNTINWVASPAAWGKTGPAGTFPQSTCDCLSTETSRWNALSVPRDDLSHNSNFTLHCLTTRCGILITFFPGVIGDTPIGWNCSEGGGWAMCPSPGVSAPPPENKPCPCP